MAGNASRLSRPNSILGRRNSKCKIPEALETLKGSPDDWGKEKRRKVMKSERQTGTIGWAEAHGLYSV